MNQAEPEPSPITVLPAAEPYWPDIQDLFARTPCWCQYWRLSAGDYGRGSKEELPLRHREHSQALRRQLNGASPPGMIAYLDGKLVGWCGLGPRAEMQRILRSRTIPQVDLLPVWSVVCFLVRPGYRRRGVARALLQGAIACARSYHVPALEAYPVDPAGKRIDVNFAYVGTVSLFEKAGFRRVVETNSHSAGLPKWLMRLELSDLGEGNS